MAVSNEVRVKIRHNILLLKTFTVPQLQAITGLNRPSINTEIKRMEKEGLISRSGIKKEREGSTGGRPAVIYQLTSDPEKRFEVLQLVRAFYVTAEERVRELRRPESQHYFIAKETLEEATKKVTLTENEKAEYLKLIQKRLEYARREEKVGEEGTQLIAASFDILEAEARDTLAGELKPAIKLLDEARKVCQQLGSDDLVTEIHSYVQNVMNRVTEKQVQLAKNRMYEEVELALQDVHRIEDRFDDLPGIHRSVESASWIATQARQERINALADEKASQAQAVADAVKQILTAQLREMLGTAQERKDIHVFPPEPKLQEKAQTDFASSFVGLSWQVGIGRSQTLRQ